MVNSSISLLKISVIIPTYNNEKTIEKCLVSILSQTYPSKEILIVDGGSKDRTLSICKKFPVKIVMSKSNIVGLSRQIGVEESNGDICAFIDSDVILPSKAWLTQMEKHFSDKTPRPIAGVFGLGLYDKSLPSHVRLMIATGPRNPPSIVSVDDNYPVGTGHTMILRSVILEVGGFRKDLRRGQDFELTNRIVSAGYCFIYDKNLDSYHIYSQNWFGLLKKMLRTYKVEAVQGFPKNPSSSPKMILKDLVIVHFIRAIIFLFYKQSSQ
jgi:glycosyltransferase involved in cell wall biosynthesis